MQNTFALSFWTKSTYMFEEVLISDLLIGNPNTCLFTSVHCFSRKVIFILGAFPHGPKDVLTFLDNIVSSQLNDLSF